MQEKHAQIEASPYAWPHDASLDPRTTALVIIDMQRDFCEEGGYLSHQGYDISPTRAIIPSIQTLLQACRAAQFPIFHTREGHRPDLSTLCSRERFRSRNNPSGMGIGDRGPLGRLLIRGEPGHDIVPELYPSLSSPPSSSRHGSPPFSCQISNEIVIDKPSKGAFTSTDFDQILRNRQIRNLIVVGVTTDVCVHTTIREANDRGYECLLVQDCCAASEAELHDAAVKMMTTEGGIFGAVSSLEHVLRGIRGSH